VCTTYLLCRNDAAVFNPFILIRSLTFATVDTTSSTLSRSLHLLAQHPEITDARAEKGDLPYDELISLPYLEAIVRETLRLYPAVSFLTRTCARVLTLIFQWRQVFLTVSLYRTRQDIIMPLSKPLRGLNGEEIHEILVPNNTNLFISIMEANRNPGIWGPDALEWIPERWLCPLPSSVSDAHVPGIYSHLLVGNSNGFLWFWRDLM